MDARRQRRARWFGLAIAGVLGVVALDLSFRVAGTVEDSRRLERHPTIAERLERTRDVLPRLTRARVLGPPGQMLVPDWGAMTSKSREVLLTTFDELGPDAFRDPVPTAPTPEGVVRVVCLGGSTTWGPLGNGVSWPAELRRLLGAEFGDARIEVVNLGIPVSNSATTLVLARRLLAEPVTADVVILYQGFNDIMY